MATNTTSNEILERVMKVVAQCSGIDVERLGQMNLNAPLTGSDYGLSPTDLVYILFELEKECHIRFSEDALNHYGFSTISGICKLINNGVLSSFA